jgi:YVTN family beta-propeller protein
MLRTVLTAFALLLAALLCGCKRSSDNPVTPPARIPWSLLVANSTGYTVSAVDPAAGTVTLDAFKTGKAPNQVAIAGGKIFVVNSLSNSVQVLDTAAFAPLGTIEIGTGANPMNILVSGTKGYVACLLTNDVRVVNLATGTVVKSIPCGVGTTGIAATRGKVYATNTGFNGTGYDPGSVTVIDTASDAGVATVGVGTNPQAADIGPDGFVHVVCTGDYGAAPGVVSVIDPASDVVVRTIPIGGQPASICFSSAGTAFVGYYDGVATYDGRTYAIIDSSSRKLAGAGGSGIAADRHGAVYVADFAGDRVLVLGPARTLVTSYTVGHGPVSIALKP